MKYINPDINQRTVLDTYLDAWCMSKNKQVGGDWSWYFNRAQATIEISNGNSWVAISQIQIASVGTLRLAYVLDRAVNSLIDPSVLVGIDQGICMEYAIGSNWA